MYTGDLTVRQARLIIRAHESFGIGVVFMPSRIRSTIAECRVLVELGYMTKTSTGFSGNCFRLTDKAQPIIDANN